VKLKDKLDALEGKKAFDPAKAFQPRSKENDVPQEHRRLRDGKTVVMCTVGAYCSWQLVVGNYESCMSVCLSVCVQGKSRSSM